MKVSNPLAQSIDAANKLTANDKTIEDALSKVASSLNCKKVTDYLKVLPSALTPEIVTILENLVSRTPQAAYIYGAILSNEPDDLARRLRGAKLIVQADASKFIVPNIALGKAHYQLGDSLLNETDYKKNEMGAKHMIEAAKKEYEPAFHRAAKLYEAGNYGIGEDFFEAYKWLVIAAARTKDMEQQNVINSAKAAFESTHRGDWVKEGQVRAKDQMDRWDKAKVKPV